MVKLYACRASCQIISHKEPVGSEVVLRACEEIVPPESIEYWFELIIVIACFAVQRSDCERICIHIGRCATAIATPS